MLTVTGVARVWFATVAALGALAYVGPAVAGPESGSSAGDACETGRAYLSEGEVDKALETYLRSLNATTVPCIDSGLVAVANAKRLEAAYCARGETLAKAGRDDDAVRQYALAIDVNVASECARKGLALPSGSKSRTGRFFDYLPTFPIQLGSLVLMLAVGLGLLALLRSVVLRKATLVVRAFADGALDKKVGSAFGGLVEEQLIGFWQTGQRARDDGYNLDLVVANVELLAQDEALGDAVGELAQVPQLQLVAGVVAFVDRAFLQRRLSAVGELLPEGAAGCGVALSLFKRKKLEARGTLWEKPAVRPNPGSGRTGPSVVARYYGLAAAAAAWVQFEASRVLDDRVGLITSSAESFSLLSAGIDEHRAAASTQEPKRYRVAAKKYTEALKIDRENVAALVNSSVVDARRNGDFAESIQKLERARSILERRYMESAKTRKAISKRPELADPTWYRIRYGTRFAAAARPQVRRRGARRAGVDRLDVRRSHGDRLALDRPPAHVVHELVQARTRPTLARSAAPRRQGAPPLGRRRLGAGAIPCSHRRARRRRALVVDARRAGIHTQDS